MDRREFIGAGVAAGAGAALGPTPRGAQVVAQPTAVVPRGFPAGFR